MSGDLALVKRFTSDFDADFARTRLADAGIEAIVLRDDAGGMLPPFQMVEGVRLMVRRQDLARAQELLEGQEE